MKALKEKRIRLRSLWRRGLVILSLFALVFAGCSDSSNDGGGVTSSLKTIQGAVLTGDPLSVNEVQYEGFPINLDGIKALVRYNDNTTETITDPSRFYLVNSSSLVAVPYYDSRFQTYWVYLSNSQYVKSIGTITFSKGIEAVYEIFPHGELDKRTYYSDDIPDFSGITLEMRYTVKGENDTHDALLNKSLPLPKEWKYWTFSEPIAKDEPFVQINFPNATVKIQVDEIYYVSSLVFDPEPAFLDTTNNPIFIDDDYVFSAYKIDTLNPILSTSPLHDAWVDRLGADTKLKVTYTGTVTGFTDTKTYSIPELKTMRDYTDPRTSTERNPRLMLVDVPYFALGGTVPKGDNAINSTKGCTVTFAYRGIPMDEAIPVYVFGQYMGITAESKDGEDLVYNIYPKEKWPDTLGGDSISTLADKLVVTATYALYTDKSTTATKVVKFDDLTTNHYGLSIVGNEADGTPLSTYGLNAPGDPNSHDDQLIVAMAGKEGKSYKINVNFTPVPDTTVGGYLYKSAKPAKITVTFINVTP